MKHENKLPVSDRDRRSVSYRQPADDQARSADGWHKVYVASWCLESFHYASLCDAVDASI